MNPRRDILSRLRIPFFLSLGIAACYFWTLGHPEWVEILGNHPLDLNHLQGILTGPLAHGSSEHLWNNLVGFFALSSMLYLVYDQYAGPILTILWVGTGLMMFLIARPQFMHIGVSGVIYSLIFFMITSGLIIRRKAPLNIAIVVGVYYGGSFWGMFPIEKGVSWDGHLAGAIVGFISAWGWRKRILSLYPPDEEPQWMSETDDTDEYDRFHSGNT